MAEEIVRKCDVIKRGQPHGVRVADDKPTRLVIGEIEYEMDICEEDKEMLMKRLEPYLQIARPMRTRIGNTTRKALPGARPFTTKEVRQWLEDQGREVASSGRLPNDLIEEYRTAHSL